MSSQRHDSPLRFNILSCFSPCFCCTAAVFWNSTFRSNVRLWMWVSSKYASQMHYFSVYSFIIFSLLLHPFWFVFLHPCRINLRVPVLLISPLLMLLAPCSKLLGAHDHETAVNQVVGSCVCYWPPQGTNNIAIWKREHSAASRVHRRTEAHFINENVNITT